MNRTILGSGLIELELQVERLRGFACRTEALDIGSLAAAEPGPADYSPFSHQVKSLTRDRQPAGATRGAVDLAPPRSSSSLDEPLGEPRS